MTNILMLHQHVTLLLGSATESEVRVYVRSLGKSTIVKIEGSLHGPTCEYARTLPAEYPLRPLPEKTDTACLAEALLLDPCYWTPTLPLQYELELTLTHDDGSTLHKKQLIGLRRWATQGANLWLGQRRTVLRGCRVESLTAERMQEARSAGAALLVDPPSDEFCAEASRQGIPLLVDLREIEGQLEEIRRLSWHPAIMIAMLSSHQKGSLEPPLLTARYVTPETSESDIHRTDCDLLAVELATNESPPDWLANCRKPVLAIRRGETYSELSAARAACDRLQADLAPQFDLAGYFVSS